jgi:hypothetical protein
LNFTEGINKQECVNTILSNLATIGQPGIKVEDLPKLLPADRYETEMDLMAQAGAYWEIAVRVSPVPCSDVIKADF